MKFLIYSSLIFMAALLGGLLPLLIPVSRENGLKLFVSLGAGLLLGMSFIHMIPEASHLLPQSYGIWLLFGFILLLVLERFVMVHACDEGGCHYHTIGVAAFVGLTVHGMIEGLALGSSLFVSSIGPLVLVAILSHKIPSTFTLTTILRLAGRANAQILFFVIGVALSGPAGVLLAYGILRDEAIPTPAGVLLALSAGTFLYIAACDLLPEVHRSNSEKFKRLLAFSLGIGLSFWGR